MLRAAADAGAATVMLTANTPHGDRGRHDP